MATLILGLCDRFHALPSQVMAEDASILQLLAIERLAYPDQQQSAGGPGPYSEW